MMLDCIFPENDVKLLWLSYVTTFLLLLSIFLARTLKYLCLCQRSREVRNIKPQTTMIDLYHTVTIFVRFPVHTMNSHFIKSYQTVFPSSLGLGYIDLNGRKTRWLHHDKSLLLYTLIDWHFLMFFVQLSGENSPANFQSFKNRGLSATHKGQIVWHLDSESCFTKRELHFLSVKRSFIFDSFC